MTAAVILLNWRNASDTLACIESVLASRYRDFQILVCDNASGDGSVERFRAWSAAHASVAALDAIGPGASCDAIRAALLHRVVWIETGGNLGFAGGNNVALKLALAHSTHDFFWLLNNDCEVAPEALGTLVARMQQDASLGICGARIRYFQAPGLIQAYGGARHNRWSGRAQYVGHLAAPDEAHDQADVERALSYVSGASMFVRRAFVEDVGLMYEGYFLYFEEIDWAVRGRKMYRLGYEPAAVVFHKEGATIGSSSDTRQTSYLSDFYLFRNRLRFTARFYPYALPSVWLVMLLQALRRGARGQRDRMWLIVQILFGRRVL
ncbi:MAG: glycosyltransferase family 2 protein [Rhodocyclaceae bacterium]|nr:glycosyltransferase family 2 protein [Rhodocyclaceae bacterium]